VVNKSECINDTQYKTWEDKRKCETEFNKPEPYGPCEKNILRQLMPWILIAVAAIIILISAIAITKGVRTRKARKILGAKPEAEARPKEAKPSEENPELKEFIKKARARGMSTEKIRKELLDAGWPQEVIDSMK